MIRRRPALAASFVVVVASAACDEDPKPTRNPPAPPSTTEQTAPMAANPPAPVPQLGEGDEAPGVTMKLHDGSSVELSSLKGELVFVYFYPKDDTPGCTVEAQGLRDNYEALQGAGVKVFGVSLQNAESHKSFIDKHELPFPLVVDEGGKIAEAFNVPVKGEFAARHSFLIGKDGKLLKVWRQVKPDGHAEQVLEAVEAAKG